MNPETILTSADTLSRIETTCQRRFPDPNEADECYLYIIDTLKASDYKRLRAFQGRSRLSTYVYTLIHSLATDFKRKKYGRRRIPKRVSKLGKWAEVVYAFVCWKKFSFDDAYDLIRADGLFDGTFKAFLSQTDPIRKSPCPENPRFVSGDADAGEMIRNTAAPGDSPLEAIIEKLDREKRIRAIQVIRKQTAGFSEEDQLLVRLVYGSDHTAAAAGRVIGIRAPAARKRLRRLLTKYREELLKHGIRES